MRSFNFQLPCNDAPTYLRVAESIRNAISSGLLNPGEAIPSVRELAKLLGVHRNTILVSISELVAEGWLSAERRKCYRVSEELPARYFHSQGSGKTKTTRSEYLWQLANKVELNDLMPAGPSKYEFRWGFCSAPDSLDRLLV